MTQHSRISAVSTVAAFLFVIAASSFSVFAQQTTAGNAVVPTLVNFSGVLTGGNGKPLTGITGVTFSLYAEQNGGSPLWLETQNVQPDKAGNYSVMLGSTSSQGLPSSLFVAGQARWLEVQAQGQEPQPRVMLLSVPYALKAGDAQTLGGMPASAFMPASRTPAASSLSVKSAASTAAGPAASGSPLTLTGTGKKDYIPLWLSSTELGVSKLFQSTSGDLGVGTTTPGATLDVDGTINAASAYNLAGEPFAFGSYTLENAFLGFAGNTTTTGSENTAAGQAAMVFNTTGYANTAIGNFAMQYNTTGYSNTASGVVALDRNSTGYGNTATGVDALYWNTTGLYNTADGYSALALNSTGSYNTASGYNAGQTLDSSNITQSYNTFVGAGSTASTGTLANATAIGANAEVAASNAMVLGSINGVNGATADTFVGIGTTAPRSKLEIDADLQGALGPTVTLTNNGGRGLVSLDMNTYTPSGSGTYNPGARIEGTDDLDYSVDLYFQSNIPGAPNQGLHTNMAILSNGTVGVRTATPQATLDVWNGLIRVGGTTTPFMPIQGAYIGWNALNGGGVGETDFINNEGLGGGGFAFMNTPNSGTPITTLMFINASSGNVGIGTTSPDSLLSVNGSADKPGGGSWGTFSDRRLKDLQGNFNAGLSQIMRINPVRYRYKQDNGMGISDHGEHVGVVAQEIKEAIPEAVTRNSQGYLLVNNDPVIWAMLNAIKEQQGLIQKQQKQIRTQQAQLKTQLSQLKAQQSRGQIQEAQISELMSQVKAIQASLNTNGRTGSEVRTVKAQVPMVRQ